MAFWTGVENLTLPSSVCRIWDNVRNNKGDEGRMAFPFGYLLKHIIEA